MMNSTTLSPENIYLPAPAYSLPKEEETLIVPPKNELVSTLTLRVKGYDSER